MSAVMGATGNTGRVAVEALLAAGKPVRAIARSGERLAAPTARGAEAAVGNAEGSRFVTKAFQPTLDYVAFPDDGVRQDLIAGGFTPELAELFEKMAWADEYRYAFVAVIARKLAVSRRIAGASR